MLADLHIHSCYSDGTDAPEEIALAASRLGLGLIAVADHNSWSAFSTLQPACQRFGLATIRAAEFDCKDTPFHLHILGYGFEPTPRLEALAEHSRALLLKMSDDLVEAMLPDYPQLSVDAHARYPYDPQKGGWKTLYYLAEQGVCKQPADAMRLYARYGCDYIDYPFPDAGEICAAIHEAGGYAVLAHPCNYFSGCSPSDLHTRLTALQQKGIDGIECYYPANSPEMTTACLSFCQKRGLLITAGSDSHGNFAKESHGVTFALGSAKKDSALLQLGNLQSVSGPAT